MRKAAYLSLSIDQIKSRAKSLRDMLKSCVICPRNCRVNRIGGEMGECRIGPDPVISSFGPHFGEEPPLVGKHGSGTIFFTGCNLHCVFCQNYEISQLRYGETVDCRRLADIMIHLQDIGCHNINLVTPTHQVPAIIEGLAIAVSMGLTIPIVYNSGGYDSVETLRLLDGIIDIYMPDMKYGDNAVGRRLSGVPDYWDRSREAVREMHRQVGDLEIGEIAVHGLLVRHLVLPNGLAGTEKVMRFIAEEISCRTYVNIMDQYRPCYLASEDPDICRQITREEFKEAISMAVSAGLSCAE